MCVCDVENGFCQGGFNISSPLLRWPLTWGSFSVCLHLYFLEKGNKKRKEFSHMQEREARETPTQRAGMDESDWEKEGWQDLFLRGTEWWAQCLHRCFTSLAGWASRSAASHYKYSTTQTCTTYPKPQNARNNSQLKHVDSQLAEQHLKN